MDTLNIESIGKDFFNEYSDIFYSISGYPLSYEGTDKSRKIYFSTKDKNLQLIAETSRIFKSRFPQSFTVSLETDAGKNWYSFALS